MERVRGRTYVAAGRSRAVASMQGPEFVPRSEGRSKPRAGALYQALDVLADAGLVETAREEMVDGRIRKYFSLTSAGRERLVSESLNRRQEADVAMTRLGLA